MYFLSYYTLIISLHALIALSFLNLRFGSGTRALQFDSFTNTDFQESVYSPQPRPSQTLKFTLYSHRCTALLELAGSIL